MAEAIDNGVESNLRLKDFKFERILFNNAAKK